MIGACVQHALVFKKEKKNEQIRITEALQKDLQKSPEVYGNEDLWMENMADADCYTHDDGPVELTFTVTEVPDMIPEEF